MQLTKYKIRNVNIWGNLGLLKPFRHKKHPTHICIWGSDMMQLLTAHWSPYLLPHQSRHVTVTPRTECNIMRLFTIYKFGCIIVWRPLIIELEKKQQLFWNQEGKKIIQLRLWWKIGQRYFCHLFPYSFHIIVCNVIWFSIIFLFEAGLSHGKSILKPAIMHQNSHFGGEAAF